MERTSQKKVLDNIPTFERKPGELNQFLSTIESYSTRYRILKTDLVMMRPEEKYTKSYTMHYKKTPT